MNRLLPAILLLATVARLIVAPAFPLKVAAILFSEPWKENAAWDVRLADGS